LQPKFYRAWRAYPARGVAVFPRDMADSRVMKSITPKGGTPRPPGALDWIRRIGPTTFEFLKAFSQASIVRRAPMRWLSRHAGPYSRTFLIHG
jgi:hypothetical protein